MAFINLMYKLFMMFLVIFTLYLYYDNQLQIHFVQIMEIPKIINHKMSWLLELLNN